MCVAKVPVSVPVRLRGISRKVSATTDAAEAWFEENDSEGVAFEYEVWDESDRQMVALLLRGLQMHLGRDCIPLVIAGPATCLVVRARSHPGGAQSGFCLSGGSYNFEAGPD